MRICCRLLLLFYLFGSTVFAASSDDFPGVVTLEQVLEMVTDTHPEFLDTESQHGLANAERLAIEGSALHVSEKNFLLAANDNLQQAISVQFELDRQRMERNIARAFFDVIISDYAYAAMHEEMTLAYLTFDRARQAQERDGSHTEAEVQALETAYLDAYAKRAVDNSEQRASRLRLAISTGRPEAYPDQMVEPDIESDRQAPDHEELFAIALQVSSEAKAAQVLLEMAQLQLDWSKLPDSGALPSAIAYQQALLQQHTAAMYSVEQGLRYRTLRLVQRVTELQTELAAANSELLYRELDLDKIRMQYEMEIHAQIGTGNTQVARALLRQVRAKYQLAMVWIEIDQLRGEIK